MILAPPLLPFPYCAQRSFRMPPEPRTTLPAIGLSDTKAAIASLSSSFSILLACREYIGVSMTVYRVKGYGIAVL